MTSVSKMGKRYIYIHFQIRANNRQWRCASNQKVTISGLQQYDRRRVRLLSCTYVISSSYEWLWSLIKSINISNWHTVPVLKSVGKILPSATLSGLGISIAWLSTCFGYGCPWYCAYHVINWWSSFMEPPLTAASGMNNLFRLKNQFRNVYCRSDEQNIQASRIILF